MMRYENEAAVGAGSVATDETDRLIASDKVEGTAVYNRQGERLGSVYNFMVDKRSGQVDYAVMSFGGFLGIGDSYHPLPWKALTYDTSQGGYVVDLDKDRLQGAPSYSSQRGPGLERPGLRPPDRRLLRPLPGRLVRSERPYCGRTFGSPPGVPGGGITGMVAAPPVSGGGWTMSGSTPGSAGAITPSERSSSSPSGTPVSGVVVGGSSGVVARGVFSCTSGGAGGSGLSVCARASVGRDPTEATSRAAPTSHCRKGWHRSISSISPVTTNARSLCPRRSTRRAWRRGSETAYCTFGCPRPDRPSCSGSRCGRTEQSICCSPHGGSRPVNPQPLLVRAGNRLDHVRSALAKMPCAQRNRTLVLTNYSSPGLPPLSAAARSLLSPAT